MAYTCLLSRTSSRSGASACTGAWREAAAGTSSGEAVLPANPVQHDCFQEPKAVTWVPRQACLGNGRTLWNNTGSHQWGFEEGDVWRSLRASEREWKPASSSPIRFRRLSSAKFLRPVVGRPANEIGNHGISSPFNIGKPFSSWA